jgi:hypothetical protein
MAKTKTRKLSWRDYSDDAFRTFPAPPNPESLHPGPATVDRAVAGKEESRAIIDSYAFRFPVTIVEDLDVLY